MIDVTGQSVSVWMATAPLPEFTPLAESINVDVCIVGAGIAGLTTAYLLGRMGRQAVVLDDGEIVSGETERTTAHLSSVMDFRYYELEKLHGEVGAALLAESHAAAIDLIERIVAEEQIECDFERVDGYLFVPAAENTDLLQRELAAVQRAGIRGAEILTASPLPSFDAGPALKFPRQAQFHPLKYLAALARIIVRDGGRIHTKTHASKIVGGEAGRVETTDGFVVSARDVVVATNSPVNDVLAMHTKQTAYRTYAIGASIPQGTVPKALYWDTLDSYHYVRICSIAAETDMPKLDVLIVGGEDHRTGNDDDTNSRHAHLEQWAREHFPEITEVLFRWSGQVMEPIDGVAFIGKNPIDSANVHIATGASGNGMTYGTIAGMIIRDRILGRENPWAALYEPSRKTLRAAGTFAKETFRMAAQYTDWFTGGEVDDSVEIAPGTASVVRRGLRKIAVFCDQAGVRHECSAVCPHLGGIVSWNASEQTWDCACHGSRFDRYGHVLNGPANADLAQEKPAAT